MMFSEQKQNDAVSPVVGVILMVAVTVILAAVIGSFVLNLGSNVKANPQAGVSFDQSPSDNVSGAFNVTVQLISMENANYVKVSSTGGTIQTAENHDSNADKHEIDGVGETISVTDINSGKSITVIGSHKGKTAVIQKYEVEA